MSNVYLKNKTSSAITVAGYSVYYIDKTDAEIVEVEGADNITSSEDASGTISAITLPTSHSYTGVLFDSLRYYAKGTISNTGSVTNLWKSTSTWYYGTLTWTDESLGDLSDKIIVNSTSSSAAKRQIVFRIIFICNSNISGYHPMDTAESSQGQITNYSYNNGVHSITFYFAGTNWTSGTFSGRIQFRYLDGVTIFNNLNAFDLVSVSEGSLSKNTTSDRYDMYNVWNNSITIHAQYSVQNHVKYNAFKYLLSSVPYWYVIDGIQTDWTDDLSSIGYSEVQPVVLPTVTVTTEWVSQDKSATSLNNTYRRAVYDNEGAHFPYSSQLVYAPIKWFVSEQDTSGNSALDTELSNFSSYPDYLYITNNTGYTITIQRVQFAVCSDSTATVVPVYNSSNVAYNAFKFTASGTYYYYVLDNTQADWVSDLSSIGYSLSPIST